MRNGCELTNVVITQHGGMADKNQMLAEMQKISELSDFVDSTTGQPLRGSLVGPARALEMKYFYEKNSMTRRRLRKLVPVPGKVRSVCGG